MSGVFLIVSGTESCVDTPLRTTKGGYPHITFMYSGKNVSVNMLLNVGTQAYTTLATKGESVSIPAYTLQAKNVVVNSFFEERTKKQRYDVLMNLDATAAAEITGARKAIVDENALLADVRDKISMNAPHVTHSIHYTQEEAEAARTTLCATLPLNIIVTGFTID